MRRRLLGSTLLVVVFAVLLLGIPLGILGAQIVHEEARVRLEQAAQRITVDLQDRIEHGEQIDAQRILRLAAPARQVTFVSHAGTRTVAGVPVTGSHMSVTLPTEDGGHVTVVAPSGPVHSRVVGDISVVAALSALSIAVAVVLAGAQARRLGRPLEELAVSAERLGAGEMRPSGRRYGVPEIDRVAEVLDHSAERLGELLGRERQFATDASHQLRTPLTALSIRLEEIALAAGSGDVREEAEAALAQVERLAGVVDALLARARHSRADTARRCEVDGLLADQLREWEPAYRRVRREVVVEAQPGLAVAATPATVSQAIATLLDNALVHGAGTVTLRARAAAEHVVVEVSDEGVGVPPALVPRVFERAVSGGSGTGLGLALARTLVESDGGRLELVHARPAVFAMFLPAAPAAATPTPAAAV